MSAESLTPTLQQFIARYIRSVGQVEILCLLSGSSTKMWTIPEVFQVIQSSEKSIAQHLETFCREGLLISDGNGTYRFSPNSPDLIQGAAELAKAFRERPVTIVEAIYKKPLGRIQDFADAFKFKKE